MQTRRESLLVVTIFLTFFSAIVVNCARAQSDAPPQVDSFRPVTRDELRQAQQALVRAAEEFRRMAPDPALVSGWDRFLRLSKWCDPSAIDTPYPEELDDLAVELGMELPGMEFPPLQTIRRAILTLADRWRDRDDPNFAEDVSAKLSQAQLLAAMPSREPQAQAELASLSYWLERHGQAAQLLSSLREKSQLPNLHITVGKRFLSAYMYEAIDRPEVIEDEILGTTITGTGQAVGFANVDLIPDSRRIAFDIVASLCVHSNTTAVKGPVSVFSRGNTGIVTRKSVFFDGRQLTSLPARSNASTQSETVGISTKFKRLANRFVMRIAEKEIEKKKDEGNAAAADHAERDANIATDNDVSKVILETNSELTNLLLVPLARRGFELRHFQCSTEAEAIGVKLGVGQEGQLLAENAPPALTANSDLNFQIDPTMVSNTASTYVGGDWFWLSDLADPANLKTGIPPPGVDLELLAKERSGDVGVMLDRFAPVTVSFNSNEIRLVIRGEQFIAQEQTWPAMEVTLHLRFQFSENSAELVSIKDPEVLPPGKTKGLSGREVTLRRILIARLKKELARPIALKPLPITRDQRLIGHLVLENTQTAEGWLQGGLKFVSSQSISSK